MIMDKYEMYLESLGRLEQGWNKGWENDGGEVCIMQAVYRTLGQDGRYEETRLPRSVRWALTLTLLKRHPVESLLIATLFTIVTPLVFVAKPLTRHGRLDMDEWHELRIAVWNDFFAHKPEVLQVMGDLVKKHERKTERKRLKNEIATLRARISQLEAHNNELEDRVQLLELEAHLRDLSAELEAVL